MTYTAVPVTPPHHPLSKEEKIAKIKGAHLSKDQEDAAIAQVNAGKL